MFDDDINVLNLKDLSIRQKELDEKIDYMLKRIDMIVNEKVNIKLSDEGFKLFLIKTTKDFVKANMDEIIKKVISETLHRLHNKIKIDAEITKKLCLSIDDEIKNVIKNNETSYSTDIIIEREIRKYIKNFNDTLKIENGRVTFLIENNEVV